MAARWFEAVTGSLDDKKQYRLYKAREKALPDAYRTAIEALDRYFMYFGGVTKSDVMLSMLDDLAVLFEQAAADATPVREIVGDNPVEFAEEFIRNYADGQWINKERARLTAAIDRVEKDQVGNDRHQKEQQ